MQWLKNCGKASGALMRESGAQTACRWGWDADFCNWDVWIGDRKADWKPIAEDWQEKN